MRPSMANRLATRRVALQHSSTAESEACGQHRPSAWSVCTQICRDRAVCMHACHHSFASGLHACGHGDLMYVWRDRDGVNNRMIYSSSIIHSSSIWTCMDICFWAYVCSADAATCDSQLLRFSSTAGFSIVPVDNANVGQESRLLVPPFITHM